MPKFLPPRRGTTMAIAVCEADVTVVSPPELVEHVRAWARTLDRVTRS